MLKLEDAVSEKRREVLARVDAVTQQVEAERNHLTQELLRITRHLALMHSRWDQGYAMGYIVVPGYMKSCLYESLV